MSRTGENVNFIGHHIYRDLTNCLCCIRKEKNSMLPRYLADCMNGLNNPGFIICIYNSNENGILTDRSLYHGGVNQPVRLNRYIIDLSTHFFQVTAGV